MTMKAVSILIICLLFQFPNMNGGVAVDWDGHTGGQSRLAEKVEKVAAGITGGSSWFRKSGSMNLKLGTATGAGTGATGATAVTGTGAYPGMMGPAATGAYGWQKVETATSVSCKAGEGIGPYTNGYGPLAPYGHGSQCIGLSKITTWQECAAVAEYNSKNNIDKNVGFGGQFNWGILPPGCVLVRGGKHGGDDKYHWNDNIKSTTECGYEYTCICKPKTCIKCPINTYSEGGINPTCTPCRRITPGRPWWRWRPTTNFKTGQTSIGCIPVPPIKCQPGYAYINNGISKKKECRICKANTYSKGGINPSCTPCPKDRPTTNWKTGQTKCISVPPIKCEPGYGFINDGITKKKECTICDTNSYSNGGIDAKCTPCPSDRPVIKDFKTGQTSINSCIPAKCEKGEGLVYEIRTSGQCLHQITTEEECKAAAEHNSNNIDDNEGYGGSAYGKGILGCFYSAQVFHKKYLFNNNKAKWYTKRECSNEYKCICKTKTCSKCPANTYSKGATCAKCPHYAPYTATNVDITFDSINVCTKEKNATYCDAGFGYDNEADTIPIRTTGRCSHMIRKEEDCKAAAIYNKKTNVDNNKGFQSQDYGSGFGSLAGSGPGEEPPPGCYKLPNDKYYFNPSLKSTQICKTSMPYGSYKCVCKPKDFCTMCQGNTYKSAGTGPCKECIKPFVVDDKHTKCYNPEIEKALKIFEAKLIAQKEKQNDLSIKNSRLWQKEQIRLQHDALMAKRKQQDDETEKRHCKHEREDGTVIFPAIEISNEIELNEDTTCIDTNRDELLQSFCSFRIDLENLFTIQGIDKEAVKMYWPNICCKERKDTTLAACADPTGKIKREDIIPFALSQGGNYSRHNLYVEVTDTIKENGYLQKGLNSMLNSPSLASIISTSKKEEMEKQINLFFNDISLCGPRILNAPGKSEGKLCQLFIPYQHSLKNVYTLIERSLVHNTKPGKVFNQRRKLLYHLRQDKKEQKQQFAAIGRINVRKQMLCTQNVMLYNSCNMSKPNRIFQSMNKQENSILTNIEHNNVKAIKVPLGCRVKLYRHISLNVHKLPITSVFKGPTAGIMCLEKKNVSNIYEIEIEDAIDSAELVKDIETLEYQADESNVKNIIERTVSDELSEAMTDPTIKKELEQRQVQVPIKNANHQRPKSIGKIMQPKAKQAKEGQKQCKHGETGSKWISGELISKKQTFCTGYKHLDLSSKDIKNIAVHYLQGDFVYDDKNMEVYKNTLRYTVEDNSCPAAPLFEAEDISIQQVAMDVMGRKKEWVAVVNLNTNDKNGYLQSELPYCKVRNYLIGSKVNVKAYVDDTSCCDGLKGYKKCIEVNGCTHDKVKPLKDKMDKHYSKDVVLTGTQYTVENSHVSRRRLLQGHQSTS